MVGNCRGADGKGGGGTAACAEAQEERTHGQLNDVEIEFIMVFLEASWLWRVAVIGRLLGKLRCELRACDGPTSSTTKLTADEAADEKSTVVDEYLKQADWLTLDNKTWLQDLS